MIFSSFSFILFFLALLSIYSQAKTTQQRAAILLAGSILFYASWEPIYLLLLGLSLFVNHRLYLGILRHRRRFILVAGIVFNLLVLGAFKYIGLFVETGLWLARLLGFEVAVSRPEWANWVLPLGISFFTFQMLSALIDAYRGDWRREVDFREWCLYVTFFPQLIAGPIVRSKELFDQIENLQPLSSENLRVGAAIFAGGLLKKAVFADNLAPLVDRLYSHPEQLDFAISWLATTAFGLQIYLDFSGYSEMALGLGWMLGVQLPRNFKYPYISRNFSEFWTRWHITLSQWLRDYLYIPLGGSRCSLPRTYTNLMITMLLGGLWHGAGWTFVFWGFLHGIYLVVYHRMAAAYGAIGMNSEEGVGRFVSWLGLPLTFVLTSFTWVFFRALSFTDAWTISGAMLGLASPGDDIVAVRLFEIVLVGFTFLLVMAEPFLVGFLQKRGIEWWWTKIPFPVRGVVYASFTLLIVVLGGYTQKFIYFDF
ncbi:MAG TPA: MBOAT family protein [Gammaproteobacteria bacterium]|nr:MBOAT family protein [Gammaproteobacteria bacterium]